MVTGIYTMVHIPNFNEIEHILDEIKMKFCPNFIYDQIYINQDGAKKFYVRVSTF